MNNIMTQVCFGSAIYLGAYGINLARTVLGSIEVKQFNWKELLKGIAKQVFNILLGVGTVGVIYVFQKFLTISGVALDDATISSVSALAILAVVSAGIVTQLKKAIQGYTSAFEIDNNVKVKITPEPGSVIKGGVQVQSEIDAPIPSEMLGE